MFSFAFEGLGTHWQVLVDEIGIAQNLQVFLEGMIVDFEKRFSRFLPESEINKLAFNGNKKTEISEDLMRMLRFGLQLKELTDGAFDPNIAEVMTNYGYDEKYSFQKKSTDIVKGNFWLEGENLCVDGNVKLDLGAFGKGYLVDQIASYLRTNGIKHFLVNGGGDIYASVKRGGDSWLAAVEHPLDAGQIIGEMGLKNQALATSSSQKRRVGDFHHLVNGKTDLPANKVLSVSVLGSSAMIADGVATAIFVSQKSLWPMIVDEFGVEFLVIFPDLSFEKSKGFPSLY